MDILNQILPTFITFFALQVLRKVLICCEILFFGVCHYVNVQFTARIVINMSHYGERNLNWNVY